MPVLSRKSLWENTPPSLKRATGCVLKRVRPQYFLGRRFRTIWRFAQDTEGWGTEQLQAYQLARLRDICALAYRRTRFYRRLFDQAGFDPQNLKCTDDLARLPFICKDTVRNHLHELCAADPRSSRVDMVATGGSGGVPLSFYIGADRSATEYAYLVASWQRAAYQLGTPMAVFRGRIVAPDRTGLRHHYDPLLRHHYYSAFHMTDACMAQYAAHLSRIGPCFLHAYPSAAATLARFFARTGRTPPYNIKGIIAESEIVYPEQRRYVESVFQCRLFSCYGQSEKLVLAAGCEHSDDYHVWPTYGYFELVDERGRPVTTPGQRGEIVGTGFINRVVPFIRYRTGDFATFVSDHCGACGRKHPIISQIRGHRIHEFLVADDGSAISWTALNMHDDTFAGVQQFQFYQDQPGRAALRIVPGDGFGENVLDRIRANLGRKLDGRVRISVELTDAIPLSPRGKSIYVDQRLRDFGLPERDNTLPAFGEARRTRRREPDGFAP